VTGAGKFRLSTEFLTIDLLFFLSRKPDIPRRSV
jgi:hypothetical protein